MSENVYEKLGERLNQYQVKMLLVEPLFRALREIYSKEDAELGAEYPSGSHTAAEAAKIMGRDEAALKAHLEKMAYRGTMFSTKEGGETRYALTPFVPGVVEFQLMRATDTPSDRRMAKALEDLMEGEMGNLMREVLQDKEMARQYIQVAPARTITIEKELPTGSEIYPYEKASALIEGEKSFGVAKCYCRHHMHLLDRDCQVKGVPEYSCLMFGKVADYVIDRNFGKRITKQEAQKIAKECAEVGLVHNVNNFSGSLVFMCNCCGCCCGFLRLLKKFDTDIVHAYSNFTMKINAPECTGCEVCIDICPMKALSMKDNVAVLDSKHCIGCGNCVSVCPAECMKMERRIAGGPPVVADALKALGI